MVNYNTFTGRTKIRITKDEKTKVNANFIANNLQTVLMTHGINRQKINILYNYDKGVQEILKRKKTVRDNINNTVVENRASQIVNFKTGYQFGRGGFYIDTENNKRIDKLNNIMESMGKHALDIELGTWLNICGVGYRFVRNDVKKEFPFVVTTLDSRNAGAVYSNDVIEELLFTFVITYGEFGTPIEIICYTDTHWFRFSGIALGGGTLIDSDSHSFGENPIIEYVANHDRMGSFERVLALLDALNLLQSDRLNAIEQFVQSFMVFKNVEIDETGLAEFKELGAIKIKSTSDKEGSIDLVTAELDQTQTQTLKNDIMNAINEICSMPDRQGSATSTGDTGIAVEMRDGWTNAELFAVQFEAYFKRSERIFIRQIARYINEDNSFSGEKLNPDNILLRFMRNPRNDRSNSVNSMISEIGIGIDPKIALENSGLYADPDKVYQDSEKLLKIAQLIKMGYNDGKDEESEISDNKSTERTVNTKNGEKTLENQDERTSDNKTLEDER